METNQKYQGEFCTGCHYLSQQLNAPIHFRHTPGDCPRKAANVKMFKMEDDAYFNETGDDHIGNSNINNISSHYDKIEFKTAVSCQTESNPEPSLHVALEVNVLIQSVETNDCGTPIENSTYETTNSEYISDIDLKRLQI